MDDNKNDGYGERWHSVGTKGTARGETKSCFDT